MRTPQPPFDGEDEPCDGAPDYEWLDEWLCEYVDGTMDPSLEIVFEKYVEANPELKAHVERLRQTRELLKNCGPPEGPSTDTQGQVCSEVEEDFLQSSAPLSTLASKRPLTAMGVASSVAVALVVGFLAGAIFRSPPPLSPTSGTSSASPAEQSVPATIPDTPPPLRSSPTFRLEEASAPPRRLPLHQSIEPVSESDTSGEASPLTTAGTR
ncbi:MAG: anti-sigma factor [Salinibacter sp.]|uniref:anti-sigma factor family protein n=1 Tax=Salinibacter sp. TaxID=2065818 RepID=UPI0035D4FB23